MIYAIKINKNNSVSLCVFKDKLVKGFKKLSKKAYNRLSKDILDNPNGMYKNGKWINKDKTTIDTEKIKSQTYRDNKEKIRQDELDNEFIERYNRLKAKRLIK